MAMAILGLAATAANAADLYWDGGTTDIVVDGDGASDGGAGTWDTAILNWDQGASAHVAWPNTSADKAIFGGTAGEVDLDSDITLNHIQFDVSGYGIGTANTEDKTLGFGGTNPTIVFNQGATIYAGITGKPHVYIDVGAAHNYFDPSVNDMDLGDVSMGSNDRRIYLQGTTTGNSVGNIQGGNWEWIYKNEGGTWAVGDVVGGNYIFEINDGNLIANGKIQVESRYFKLNGGVLHYNNPGAAGSKLTINGGNLDNTSGSAITTSTFNSPMAWNKDFTFLGSIGALSDLDLGTGAVTLTGNPTVIIQDPNTTLTIGGAIGDGTNTYGLTKAGPGTLALGGANTYGGATTVEAGTLRLGAASLDDSAMLDMTSTATLDLSHGAVDTVLALKLDGVLQPAGTYTSIATWLTGSGSIQAGGGLAPAGTYFWDGGNVGGTGDAASDGGAGTWSTSNANWDKGIVAREAWTNGTGNKAIFGGTAGEVDLDSDITLNRMQIEAHGYKIGDSLNEANILNFGGATPTIVAHTIATIYAGITGEPSVELRGNRHTLTFAPNEESMQLGDINAYAGDTRLTLAGTTTGNSIARIDRSPSGTWLNFTKNGTGTWTVGSIASWNSVFRINGGHLIVNGELLNAGGWVQVSSGAVLHDNAGEINTVLRMDGGSLDNTSGAAITTSTYNPAMQWNGDWTFIGSNGAGSDLNLGTGAVSLQESRTVTVQHADTTLTVGGVISGTGKGLTKAGEGTLALSGASTYDGGTTIAAGTLLVNNTSGSGTGTGSVAVNDGGTLGGTGTIAGAVTIASGGAALWGFDGATGSTLALLSDLQLDSGWKLTLSGTGSPSNEYDLFTYPGGFSGTITPASIDYGATGWFGVMVKQDTGRIYLSFINGDADGNGVVNAADYIILKTHMGQPSMAGATEGDFNGNGTVNYADLVILQDNFGKSSAGATGTIPKPATLFVMMAAGLPALLKRRRSPS